MTKTEFLNALKVGLSDLPRGEREERVNFYREMIDDRMEEGLSEEEAVSGIGTVSGIVSQILSERPVKRSKPKPAKRGGGRVGWILLIVLGFPVWFPVLLSLFLSAEAILFSLWIALWSADFALAGFSVLGLASAVVTLFEGNFPTAVAMLGMSAFSAGLSILCFYGCIAGTVGLWRLMGRILSGFGAAFKRKETSER